MRNTTMKDKLTEVLGARGPKSKTLAFSVPHRSEDTIIATAQHTATQLKKLNVLAQVVHQAIEKENPGHTRYIVPPKRRNPFSHRAYSYDPVPEEVSEPQAESEENDSLEAAAEVATELVEPVEPSQDAVEPEDVKEIQDTEKVLEESPQKELLQETADEVPSAPAPAVPPVAVMPLPVAATPMPQPEVATTPNLGWLDEHTPFAVHLRGIVDDCRVAKSKVAFTLQQSIIRQKELTEQIKTLTSRLEAEEFTAEQQREALRQLDDTISACALVAEQSSAIDVTLLAPPNHKHKQKSENSSAPDGEVRAARGFNHRWGLNDGTACRRQDIIKFFENNRGVNWTAPEIRKMLPPAKQAHAKHYLNVLLATLYKDGVITRIGNGIYRSLA